MDDYGYAGIDFCNYLDLVLLEDYDWDTSLGMLDLFISTIIYIFYAFHFFYVFGV